MDPSPHLWFLNAKQRLLDQHTSLYEYQTSPVILSVQNSVISTRATCLHGSLPSSVVFACKQRDLHQNDKSLWVPAFICGFCMQNSVIWTCIQISMGTRPHLSFCAWKTSWLAQELQVSVGPRPHQSFCARKTACLASEILVSMGPSPHLRFLDAKQRLLVQNNKSLWVSDLTCCLVPAKQRD